MIEQYLHTLDVFMLICELSPAFADLTKLAGRSMLIHSSTIAVVASIELFGNRVLNPWQLDMLYSCKMLEY